MMKRPIGLAIAFTLALSFLRHSPGPAVTQANQETQAAQAAPTQVAPATEIPEIPPVSPSAGEPQSAESNANPELQQREPQKLDMPQRIASLVPGVERLLEAATGQ